MDRIDTHRLSAEAAERLERLFRLHNSTLMGYAVTRTRSYAAAEDVVGETWARAAASLHQLKATDDADAYRWLRGIAFHAAAETYSPTGATVMERPRDWADAVAAYVLAPESSAEDTALTEPGPTTLPENLAAAVDALPETQRTVVLLRSNGLSLADIGDCIDRHRSAVHYRLKTARRTLRLALAG
ncbi:RNA polymerase sigma factor [Streptomyces sp. cg2]|uniref:RNA polymerase sigma factor n=1 Tax=Streptomyces sp. cg2 TaxID=3238799 RepID=UPI0034E2102E